jgi:hypothetical protein
MSPERQSVSQVTVYKARRVTLVTIPDYKASQTEYINVNTYRQTEQMDLRQCSSLALGVEGVLSWVSRLDTSLPDTNIS